MVAGRLSNATARAARTLPALSEQMILMQARALSVASLETLDGPGRVEGVYF